MDIVAYDSWPSFESDSAWVCASWRGNGALALVPAMTISVPLTIQGTPLAEVAAGWHDSSFVTVARSMVSNGWGHSIIRLGWEFNGTWMPWAAGNDPVGYVAAFRHVVAVMRSVPGASFTFDWCSAWGPAQTRSDSVYPGDDVVDIIGMDLYSRYYAPADADPVHAWASYLAAPFGLNWLVAFAQQHGKPISIPEWGTGEWYYNDGGVGGGDNAVFVTSMAAFLRANNAVYSDYWDYADTVYNSRVSDGEHPNAGNALKAALGGTPTGGAVPGPIPYVGLGGAATGTTLSVSFSAPSSGGAPLAYVVQERVSGSPTWTTAETVTWVGWQTLSGLSPGTVYDVRVYATNSAGSGSPSAIFTEATSGAPVLVSPPSVVAAASSQPLPGPIPYIGAADASTNTSVSLSFSAPYTGAAVSGYVLQFRPTGSSTWTAYKTVTWVGWQTIGGLSPGTSYDVSVYAIGPTGNGPVSAAFTVATTGTPAVAPASLVQGPAVPGPIPYIGPAAAPTATTVSFSFAAPYVGASVASYVIQVRVAGSAAWSTYGSVTWIGWQTLVGLAPGTPYEVRVYAVNAGGAGVASAPFAVATNPA